MVGDDGIEPPLRSSAAGKRCGGWDRPANDSAPNLTRTSGLPRITPSPSVHGRHTIIQIRTERFILGVLGPQRSEISISASQATDRSTFCPMPGGRSQAASDAPRTEAVLLGHSLASPAAAGVNRLLPEPRASRTHQRPSQDPPRDAGPAPRVSSLSSPRRATAVIGLDRRTRNRAVGTEYATVASERLKPHPTALAVIEEHAGIGRHRLDGPMTARGASQGRFQLHHALRSARNTGRRDSSNPCRLHL